MESQRADSLSGRLEDLVREVDPPQRGDEPPRVDEQPVCDPLPERLNWKQICERYPNEWVVLVEMDWVDNTYSSLRSAIVAGHGAHRSEPLEQTDALRGRYPRMGHFFTGRVRALRRVFVP
jgi:hypothetical protein